MTNSLWLTLLLIAVSIGAVIAYCYNTGASYDKFKKEGIRTEAKINKMEKIGASGTGNTKLRMEITFHTNSGLVTKTVKEYISPQNMVKIMKNHSVYIYYMENNHDEIFLATGEMD
ncbi:TPA: hypothetical protein QDZ66_003610 [Pluralibacter gergoviae]|mgnify:CR=1 FL=1|uniref:Uncharacterized protein n=1 Tax=Pluralibacter gergoviae TaxID=61647 RepID=A0A0J5PT62_PLUGE|nr:hypothetical protein [Pluralibacter gergoviae]EKV0931089.1 hypothetical protein [Pluralibacter gergoviae]EKV6246269.1 hypothetical protein [Pluralibacter gergoviae]EKW6618506.1 hypothetical protein [Pluralibacter gergoviae]EKW9966707.1 hypothetical protein [Pluralibacter gergoviae]ELC3074731.1 hypothetical protein [Pluralibacter gergoviae]